MKSSWKIFALTEDLSLKCRLFHVLSDNVGLMKPFETRPINLTFKDEMTSRIISDSVLVFIYVKLFKTTFFKPIFYSEGGKKHSNLRVLTVVCFFFFNQHCHMLSSPSAAPAAPSMPLKSHCCILNYLCLITSPLQGDGMLLGNESAYGNY